MQISHTVHANTSHSLKKNDKVDVFAYNTHTHTYFVFAKRAIIPRYFDRLLDGVFHVFVAFCVFIVYPIRNSYYYYYYYFIQFSHKCCVVRKL